MFTIKKGICTNMEIAKFIFARIMPLFGLKVFSEILIFIPSQNQFFRGILEPACLSVCVQNTTFCQSAGGGIKSHSVTALVKFKHDQRPYIQGKKQLQPSVGTCMRCSCFRLGFTSSQQECFISPR